MSKAVQFDSYGGIDVLEVRDVPRPVPGAAEVLVEVRAAGINPSEAVIRSGALHHLRPVTFPSGQGSDLAGVVAELGPGVSSFAVGDEVIGFSMRRSSRAEYVTVPANQLTLRPAAVPWEVAGSLFVAGVTAYAAVRPCAWYQGIRWRLRVRPAVSVRSRSVSDIGWECPRKTWNTSFLRSLPPNLKVAGWGWLSAVPLLSRMAAGCGPALTMDEEQNSISACRSQLISSQRSLLERDR